MAGVSAFGTVIKIGGTAGTAVVNVTKIDGPEPSMDTIEVTAHDSANAWREYVAGLLDAGEVSMDINWDPLAATHKNAVGGLQYLQGQRTSSLFALVFPAAGNPTYTFTAFVTKFGRSAPFENKLTAQVTLKITGAPTLV